MSDDNKDELLSQFQDISGEPLERAQFYLESADWKLDVALSAFYEGAEPQEPAPGAAAAAGRAGAGAAPPADAAMDTDQSGSDRRLNPQLFGKDSDSSDDEGQAFYAGGSSTSGQQILGPPKKKGADLVKEMFKKAREAGAEAVEGGSSSGARGGANSKAFQGTAFKLGSDSTSSEVLPGAPKPPEPREFTLKMWSNGFSIDDGELRDYNDPANRAFLQSVMSGRIPTELVREARGGEVHVNMEDHKAEEFVKPKATSKPFQGTGHMLGGIAPSIASAAATQPSKPEDNAANEAKAKDKFKPDPNEKATSNQVRLPDGSRLVIRMSETRTVGDLRQYIQMSRPVYVDQPFSLRLSHPPKELDSESATLKDAGVLNAAILLRLK